VGPYRYDNILPTISATLASPLWQNTDFNSAIITPFDAAGGSGIKYKNFSWISDADCRASGAAVPAGINKNWNGDDRLYLCIEDWAGNQGSWNGQYRLDKLPPILWATNAHPTNWRNANINITLTATDSTLSWLNPGFTKFRWNNPDCVGWWTMFTNGTPIVQSIEWANVLYLCTRDIAGNIVTWQGNYYLDKTFPVLNANSYSLLWRNTPVSITLTSTDVIYSGLNWPFTKYRWDNPDCVGWWTVYTNWQVIVYGVEGDHQLYLCNRDNAGNITTWWPQPYRIDLTDPIDSGLTYANAATNGWQKILPITLNWSASDPIAGSPVGRSNILNYDIRVYRTTSQGTPSIPADLITTITAATAIPSYVYSWIDGYSYKFEVCARDIANNTCTTWLGSPDIARVDMIPPTAAALTDTSIQDRIAGLNLPFNLSYNDGGAPVRVDYRFENNFLPLTMDPLSTPGFMTTYTYTYNRTMTGVDNDRGANGWRQISMPIDQICDQAGWCISAAPLKTFQHYIYADVVSGTVSSTSANLTDGSAIADGSTHVFDITLRDQFMNQIVPASGIGRAVDMSLAGITNSMFLNQYSRSVLSGSSIYVSAPDNPIDTELIFGTGISVQIFPTPITTFLATYSLIVKAYTPTANSYTPWEPVSDPTAAFSFIPTLEVSSSTIVGDPWKTFTQSLSAPIFKPLYTSTLTWNLRDGGFIEGTEQTNTLLITDNNPILIPAPLVSLQLEFSGSNAPSFDLYGWTVGFSGTTIATRSGMLMNPGYSPSTVFYTRLIQRLNTQVNTLSNLQFSTHFAYTIDSKNIVYNSDMIGKTGWFWSGTFVQLGNQVWIKVIGPIGSNVIWSIVTGQFSIGTSIFDSFSRSTVRNNIKKSLILATRNTSLSPYSNTISDAKTLNPGGGLMWTVLNKWPNVSIMRLEKTGWNIVLGLLWWIGWQRTIMIKWADLYITNDMHYNPAVQNSVLAVVVQKNEAWQGWNIYINPSVTNMVGTYVIDGSIKSSNDGINPIWTSNIALLKNQLYIYGSIVSENTIGGSRMSPLKCPSLINSTTCTTDRDEAQQYDLNYLRRYYLYGGEPFWWATTKVIWWGNCTWGTCTWFTPTLIKKFINASEEFAKYPVVVEYNPQIRITPPIGFEDSRE
jgi:hypothetical protein